MPASITASIAFEGIVGALAGEKLTPEHPQVWLPFWAMIAGGLGTLFAALIPMLPHHLGLPDRHVWAISSACVATLVVCHAVFLAPRFFRAMRDSWVHLPVLEFPLRLAFPLALVSQVLNALGVGLPQSAGGFLIGLYLLLLISTLNFAYLVYVLLRPEDD